MSNEKGFQSGKIFNPPKCYIIILFFYSELWSFNGFCGLLSYYIRKRWNVVCASASPNPCRILEMDRTSEVLRANLLLMQQSVTVSLDLSQRASSCLCGMSYFYYFAWSIMVLTEFLLTANANLVCSFSPLNLVLFKQIKMVFFFSCTVPI